MTLTPREKFTAFVEDEPGRFVGSIILAVTLLRLILLPMYQTSLGPDEAQYWFWGQTLDWGYYSKPPMIAWAIALPTAVFGDHVWSVRFLSPILIGGTAWLLFLTARRLYGDRPAIWTALLWLLLPAVMLGATIMSTDIPLLFFWSLGLFALVGLAGSLKENEIEWALLLGVSIGLGFLSKYAMLYFLLGWGLALALSPEARKTLRPLPLVVVAVVATLIFLPNILWNAANGMQTLSHTADNANWGGNFLNPGELLDFLGAQFGVAGPLLFGSLIFGLVTLRTRQKQAGEKNAKDMLLLSFVLPPLIIICVQALLSRAHANWAMTAYPAALILLPAWLMRMKHGTWVLWSSLGLHVAFGLFMTALMLDLSLADRLGRSNDVKRLRAWEETARQIAVNAEGLEGVIVDEREIAAHLTWEWRNQDIALYAFDLNRQPDNTYEHVFPFTADQTGTYLLATQNTHLLCAYEGFAKIEEAGVSFVDLKARRRGHAERTIPLFRVSGYQPLSGTPCAAR